MNLEAIAMRRAEEMMTSDTWRRTEPGEEVDGVRLCPRCSNPILRRGAGVCTECHAEGWRGTPCVSCGGHTHKRDRAAAGRSRYYGMCGECRRKAHEDNEGIKHDAP